MITLYVLFAINIIIDIAGLVLLLVLLHEAINGWEQTDEAGDEDCI